MFWLELIEILLMADGTVQAFGTREVIFPRLIGPRAIHPRPRRRPRRLLKLLYNANDAPMKKKQPNRSPSEWRPIAFAGYTLIALTFGVGGVWAAVAKLDKAIIASEFVETETNRKTVEHLEGGIVREILVKEGDHVAKDKFYSVLSKYRRKQITSY